MNHTTNRILRVVGRVYCGVFVGIASWGLAASSQAAVLATLHQFNRASGGWYLACGVVADEVGNLYGTTAFGGEDGTSNAGTVFQLDAQTHALTTLHSLTLDQGAEPGGLYVDAGGNIFGITSSRGPTEDTAGSVFRIDAATHEYETLKFFTGANGESPVTILVPDGTGHLYGTTRSGGIFDHGAVFRVNMATKDVTTLASFDVDDGIIPRQIVIDETGNLYGGALGGGQFLRGTLYRFDAATNSLAAFYHLNGTFGAVNSRIGLVDSAGNLYGTTTSGGFLNNGTVFRVDAGTTIPTTVANFKLGQGRIPQSNLLMDPVGNLYGTTIGGGDFDLGTVFRIDAGTNELTTIFTFDGANGAGPRDLIVDSQGRLYGTTAVGGDFDGGTVFRLSQVRWGVPEPGSAMLVVGALLMALGAARGPRSLTGG